MTKTFSLQITGEPEALMARAIESASRHGAIFNGDTRCGHFKGMGIRGEYKLESQTVHITITEKPRIASWPMVESMVKGFFS